MIFRDTKKNMYQKTLTACLIVLLLLGSVFAVQSASVNAATEGQLQPDDTILYESVVMDCLDVKFKLGEIHRTDRLLRVTLGEGYDNISSNLMGRLNSRIVENKLDGGELVGIAAEFEEAHTRFKENYTGYDVAMLDLLKSNCQSRTQTYYEQLQETKALRQIVHEDVGELSTLMQRYHDAFKDFRKDVESKNKDDA